MNYRPIIPPIRRRLLAATLWFGLVAGLPERIWAQMDNDAFAHRLRLASRGGIPALTLLNTTRELGEKPPVGAALGEVSLWLSWTPERSGAATLYLLPDASWPPGSAPPPVRIVVAKGSSVGSLMPIAEIQNSTSTNFFAEAGQEYVIAVVGQVLDRFRAGVAPVPSNDDPSNPVVLLGNVPSFLASTVGATASRFDPGSLLQKPSVWWQWVAPDDGMVTLQVTPPTGSMSLHSFVAGAERWATPLDVGGSTQVISVSRGEILDLAVTGEVDEPNLMAVHITFSPLRLEVLGGVGSLQEGVSATIRITGRPEGVRYVRAGLGNIDEVFREADPNDLTAIWTPDRAGRHSLRGFAIQAPGRVWATPSYSYDVRPRNDDIRQAHDLNATGWAADFSLQGATVEADEPEPAEPSVWFSWTAAESGPAGISVSQSSSLPGLRLRVFTGDGEPQFLWENVMTNSRLRRTLTVFPSEAGRRYLIAVSGMLAGVTVPRLEVVPRTALPLNDNFANRIVLDGSNQTVTNQLRFATLEPGEAQLDFFENSVWHQWTAPTSGELLLTTASASGTTPVVTAYWEGAFPNFRRPNILSGRTMRLPVSAGTNYFICLSASPTTNSMGPVILNWSFQASAANDRFANRQVETGAEVHFLGTTDAAGSEPGDGLPDRRTVWFTWTAPRSGDVMVWPVTPDNLSIYVYRGESLEGLQDLGWPIRRFGALLLAVTAGEVYHFAFATPQGFPSIPGGPFQAELRYYDSRANDTFDQRAPIDGSRVVFPGVNSTATTEEGEPTGLTNTLWWSWTAPVNGWTTLQSMNVGLGVFTGASLAKLAPVELDRLGDSNAVHRLRFRSQQGQTYQIVSVPTTNEMLPYSVELDMTSLGLVAPAQNTSTPPGQPLTLRLAPINWELDGLPTGRGVAIRGHFENGLRLGHLLSVDDLTWTLTNELPIGLVDFTASYTNIQGTVRASWPLALIIQHDSDHFDNPNHITTPEFEREYIYRTSTFETGETILEPSALGGSLWWHWTAPHSGDVVVKFNPAALGIFTGSRLDELSSVITTALPVAITDPRLQHTFHAQRGTTYHIKLEGLWPENRGVLSLISSPLSLAPNLRDETFPRDKVHLSSQADLPPTAVAQVEYLLDGAVLATASNPPWEVAPAPLIGTGSGSLSVRAVLKDGSVINNPAPVSLRWKEPNDDYADASLINGDEVLLSVSNLYASREPNEPSHGTDGFEWLWNQTLWWKYEAKTNGALYVYAGTQNLNDRHPPYLAAYDARRLLVGGSPPNVGGGFAAFSFPIQAGQTYHVASASRTANGLFVHFRTIPQLTNDDFSGAEPIPQLPATLLARFGLATLQDGEQWPAEWAITQSLWWRLVSPGDGFLVVKVGDQNSSGPASGLYVRAPHLSDSSVVALPSSYDLMTYPVESGRAYWLALGRNAGNVSREEVVVSFVPPAGNDPFARRLLVSGSPVRDLLPIIDCTLEPGEPDHPGVDSGQARGSVWVAWTARSNGIVTLSTGGAASLAVYEGNHLANLFPLAANSHADCSFRAWAGSTYQIAVIAASESSAVVQFTLAQIPGPPNDDFDNAIGLSGIHARLQSYTSLATREFGEPLHAGFLGGSSCWWTWRASISGIARLRTITPPNGPLYVEVYSGDQVSSLLRVPTVRSDGGSSLEFDAAVGRTYHIAVDDLNAWGGEVDIELIQTITQVQFLPISTPTSGEFHIGFAGPSGHGYSIDRSVDLKTWTEIGSGFLTGDLQSWRVTLEPNQPSEFFRLRTIGGD